MISGTRNPPPISTSSPRETTTDRSRASAPSARSTAAALLLTTTPASAPHTREQRAGVLVARAAFPRRQPVLQVRVTGRDVDRLGHELSPEWCASEVRVEQDAGCVHDATKPCRAQLRDPRVRVVDDVVEADGVARRDTSSACVDRVACAVDEQRVGQPGEVFHDALHCRKRTTKVRHHGSRSVELRATQRQGATYNMQVQTSVLRALAPLPRVLDA